MRRLRILASALVATVIVAACGGESTPKERPLTGDEAASMAAVQYDNMQAGGAVFEVAAAVTSTGESVSMSGVVDWARHTGRATVSAKGQESPVTEVAWAGSDILERRADLIASLPNLGHKPDSWILRPLDPTRRTLDRIVAILLRLSSTEPDNAILIQQTEGSAWMRTDTLRGRDVDVMRYGKQTIYWLDSGTGEMLRFEGNAASLNAPVVIDFVDRGRQTIDLPPASGVVPVSEIKDLYDAVTTP